MIATLPLHLAAAVALQRRDDRKLVIKTYNADAATPAGATQSTVELSLDDFYGTAALLPDATLRNLFTGGKHWAAYVAGAFPMLAKHKKFTRRSHGANIACFSNVPFGVGLGSSAAVATAALTALTEAFHILLDPLEIAALAQRLEFQIVGTPRGIMDPATSVLGKANHLLLLSCQPHALQGYLPVPPGFLFAAINSTVAPPVGGPAYRTARTSAFIAQALIAQTYLDFGHKKDPTLGYLANTAYTMFTRYLQHTLPASITGTQFLDSYDVAMVRSATIDPNTTYFPRAAASHHILENARTKAFLEHLRNIPSAPATADNPHARTAGQLMYQSHRAYTDVGLAHEATDHLVTLAAHRGPQKGIFGARVMGSGIGGSIAIFTLDTPEARNELQSICNDFHHATGLHPQLLLNSSPGSNESAAQRLPLSSFLPV